MFDFSHMDGWDTAIAWGIIAAYALFPFLMLRHFEAIKEQNERIIEILSEIRDKGGPPNH